MGYKQVRRVFSKFYSLSGVFTKCSAIYRPYRYEANSSSDEPIVRKQFKLCDTWLAALYKDYPTLALTSALLNLTVDSPSQSTSPLTHSAPSDATKLKTSCLICVYRHSPPQPPCAAYDAEEYGYLSHAYFKMLVPKLER